MTPAKTSPKRAPRSRVSLQVRSFPPDLPGITWLTLAEVLQYVPMSRSHWYRGIASGQLPAPHKVGHTNFWTARQIRALLEMGPKRARKRQPRAMPSNVSSPPPM